MIRQITIKPVLNGFIVDVGCQTIVFGSNTTLVQALEAYLINPDASEKAYRESSINARHFLGPNAECVCEAPEVAVPPPPDMPTRRW